MGFGIRELNRRAKQMISFALRQWAEEQDGDDDTTTQAVAMARKMANELDQGMGIDELEEQA